MRGSRSSAAGWYSAIISVPLRSKNFLLEFCHFGVLFFDFRHQFRILCNDFAILVRSIRRRLACRLRIGFESGDFFIGLGNRRIGLVEFGFGRLGASLGVALLGVEVLRHRLRFAEFAFESIELSEFFVGTCELRFGRLRAVERLVFGTFKRIGVALRLFLFAFRGFEFCRDIGACSLGFGEIGLPLRFDTREFFLGLCVCDFELGVGFSFAIERFFGI